MQKGKKEPLDIDLLTKTIDDLSVGVGIFQVEDLNDLKSIRYVFMNKVILHEMRKSREEVFGKRISEVAPEAYEHEGGLYVLETYRRVAAGGESVNLGLVEYSNHMVAGTYECSVHPIKENYVYVQLRNVTELEKAKIELEEKYELEKKNKELEQFTYITSHDLQEPLNSIIAFSDLLEKEEVSDLGRKSIDVIKESAYRMKDFIISLLEYSRIGKVKEKVSIDVSQLIDNLKLDLHDLLDRSGASIEYRGKPLVIKAVEPDLIKLFQNLIINGIKYTKQGVKPLIQIDVSEHSQNYEFKIKDNGIGIAEEHYNKIFEVFQRLHRRDEYSGTGIGLSYCKKVVELHGGQIWLTSNLGQGTTFTFTLKK